MVKSNQSVKLVKSGAICILNYPVRNTKRINVYYDSEIDQIEIYDSDEVENVDIFSISVRLRKRLKANNQKSIEINTHALAKGLYIVRMKLAGNKIVSTKFVK